ncbi:hypothetical protein PsYK624_074120 [Phanerochaete sordida]|uniref:Uncharacterized protein n=1 Tax=Phanerochaete sordida TaxID=48140 RepID=A0A9P3G8E9_9APHY|nr:hypothetical protein PsYK624_074120 [Phanerochaete sordida]
MASLRPPRTYARRRTLRASVHNAGTAVPARSSSPLEELSPSTHDVTLSEMSRRMKKRSRQVVAGKQPAAEDDAADRLAKKLRRPSQASLRESAHDSLISTVPSTPVHQHDHSLPLDTQRIYDSLFETPDQPHQSTDPVAKSYAASLASADSLSPIPVARRMLSRPSSRNLKENSGRMSRQGLASPFTSRPASRNSSPHPPSKTPVRRPLHAKSRTLSSSFLDKSATSASKNTSKAPAANDPTYDSIFSSTAPGTVLSTTAHSRSGSIPAMPSHLLDHISPQDWLVPAKALSRTPPSFEDMELDDWAGQHASFYLGAPAKISTPPRRRRTTVTLQNYRPSLPPGPQAQSQTESMDLTDVMTGAEDETTDGESGVPPAQDPAHPRRRRRTVVHMSSDSIFSSALDFSAYMTEFSPTKVHGPARPASSQPPALRAGDHAASAALDTAVSVPVSLDPAFSPDVAPASPLQEHFSLSKPPAPAANVPRPVISTPGANRRSPTVRASPLQSPGGREVADLFQTLDLDGRYARGSDEGDDSGVGLEKTVLAHQSPSRSRSSAEPHDFPENDVEPSRAARASADPAADEDRPQTHGRKRGDTIRASDYARPAMPHESASTARPSEPRALPKKSVVVPGTRRTRSGTVTLARPQTQAPGKPRATRRAANLPTIKMRINDKPLSPQGSDEEDDELLLRRGVHVQDD